MGEGRRGAASSRCRRKTVPLVQLRQPRMGPMAAAHLRRVRNNPTVVLTQRFFSQTTGLWHKAIRSLIKKVRSAPIRIITISRRLGLFLTECCGLKRFSVKRLCVYLCVLRLDEAVPS